jgi:Flp pilus assembly protein TadG
LITTHTRRVTRGPDGAAGASAPRRARSTNDAAARRRGAAVAELAVCLPLLTLIVFGSIQACNLIYLKHGVTTAAYEGTLELAKRNATNSSIITRAQQVIDARGATNTRIRLLPAGTDVSTLALGAPVTIEVTADVAPNMSLSGFFPLPRQVVARIVGTR